MQQISRKMKKFSGWLLALLGLLCLAGSAAVAQQPLYTDVYLNSINKSWQAPCGEPGTPTAQIRASIAAIPVGGILELTCYQVPITLTADIFSTVSKPILIWMPPVAVTVNANTTIPANFELCYTPGSSLTAGGGYTITDNSTPCGGGGTGPVTPNIPIAGTNGAGTVINATYRATGGVSRTAKSKLSDHLSILDYGADPTHSFDSSPSIQAALDAALAAGGGTVDMPHGWYLCNSPVTVNNTSFLPEFGYGVKVNVEGEGNATVLDYKGASGRFFTEAAGGAPSDRNSFFRDFQIVCSGPGRTISSLGVPGTGLADGFGVQNIISSEISNITVYNCGHGFTFDTPGVGWTEESDLHGLRSLNNAVGFWFTSSTGATGNSFEFTHGPDLWCGFNIAGYIPDSCLFLDAGQVMINSKIRLQINWGPPVTPNIAAIHLGSGSNPFGTQWEVVQDGCNPSYQATIFKDDGATNLGSLMNFPNGYCFAYNWGGLPASFLNMGWLYSDTGTSTGFSTGILTGQKSLVGPELTTLENQNFSNMIVNGTPGRGTVGQEVPGWQINHPNNVIALDTDPFNNPNQKVVRGTSASLTGPPGPITNTFGIVGREVYVINGWYKIGSSMPSNWLFFFADGSNWNQGMPPGGNPTTWTPFTFVYQVPTTVGTISASLDWGNSSATSDWIELYGVSCRFAGPYLLGNTTFGGYITANVLPIFATNELAIAGGLTNGMMYQTGADPSLVAVVSSITNINTVPPIPTGLTAAPGNTQNVLNWLADVGATLYNVKRSTTGGPPYTGIATVAAPTVTYTNTGLTNGVPYYYVLSASNPIGESANSAQVTATPSASAPGTYRPTTFANTGNYPAINAPAAYDGNLATPAEVFGAIVYTPMNGDTTWSGFTTTSGPWTSAILTIYSKELRADTTPGTAILEYSLNGGSSWTALHSTTSTWDNSTSPDTVTLGSTQALNLVKVQAVQPAPGVGQDTILVYEIFISAF